MTPKEKAGELFLMFYRELPFKHEVITECDHGVWGYHPTEIAKNHSLMCVDEIIENGIKWMPQVEWWMAVKKEIENL